MYPVTDQDIISAKLPAAIREKLFQHRHLIDHKVAVRLNLNGGIIHHGGSHYRLQTIHKGSVHGLVLGYDGYVTVRDAVFVVNERSRLDIIAGKLAKHPMAGVIGLLAEDAGMIGTEISFNPRMNDHFIVVETGESIVSADLVTIFNNRCYAVRPTNQKDAKPNVV